MTNEEYEEQMDKLAKKIDALKNLRESYFYWTSDADVDALIEMARKKMDKLMLDYIKSRYQF